VAQLVASLLSIPFVLAGQLFSARRSWRAVPLAQKNMTRATGGAFVLVGCTVLAIKGIPVGDWKITAGIAGLALLYLIVGIRGAHGATYDVMQAFWWAVLTIGGMALMIFVTVGGMR
jgi:hypothetical protein